MKNTTRHFTAVVSAVRPEASFRESPPYRPWVGGREDHVRNAGQHDRARTHRARLERDRRAPCPKDANRPALPKPHELPALRRARTGQRRPRSCCEPLTGPLRHERSPRQPEPRQSRPRPALAARRDASKAYVRGRGWATAAGPSVLFLVLGQVDRSCVVHPPVEGGDATEKIETPGVLDDVVPDPRALTTPSARPSRSSRIDGTTSRFPRAPRRWRHHAPRSPSPATRE